MDVITKKYFMCILDALDWENQWFYRLQYPRNFLTKPIILALSLSLTLATFWLLDSVKDPVFSIMIGGNLKKHQPLAKMISVAATLLLVCIIEFSTKESNNVSSNNDECRFYIFENLRTKVEDDINGKRSRWTTMPIATSHDMIYSSSRVTHSMTSEKIHWKFFRIVGSIYISTFAMLAYLLYRYPDISVRIDNLENHLNTNLQMDRYIHWKVLGYAQYLAIESFGSISVAAFWSFANSTLTLASAKTYYGFFIALAQLGAIGGSSLVTVQNFTVPMFFLMACIGITFQVILMEYYGYKYENINIENRDIIDLGSGVYVSYSKNDSKTFNNIHDCPQITQCEQIRRVSQSPLETHESPNSSKMFLSGVHLILRHNYLLLILGVSCLYEISLTCLDYEMKLIGLEKFSAPQTTITESDHIADRRYNVTNIVDFFSKKEYASDSFAIFMGRFGQFTNFLSLLLSYFAFPRLIANYGLNATLRLFPSLLILLTIVTYLALPLNLPAIFFSMSILKAMTYSINDPAKEILYLPTSNNIKFKSKFWIDVVGARIVKAVGSAINTYAGSAQRIVIYGSTPSIVTSFALLLVSYSAGLEFDRLMERGLIVGNDDDN